MTGHSDQDQVTGSAAAICRHCAMKITNEGYAPPMWWHLHNSSFYCDTKRAEPDV